MKLILIMGKAATGKDTIAKEVSNRLNIPIAVSFTTRDKRQGETEGVEYKFITETEFKMKQASNEIVEYASYDITSENRTYTYGLTKDQIEKSEYVIAIVNPHGYHQLMDVYKDNIISILIDCNDRDRLIRYLDRDKNVNVNEMIDRYHRDKIDFTGLNNLDYIVYNEDFIEGSINKVVEIITEEIDEDN